MAIGEVASGIPGATLLFGFVLFCFQFVQHRLEAVQYVVAHDRLSLFRVSTTKRVYDKGVSLGNADMVHAGEGAGGL